VLGHGQEQSCCLGRKKEGESPERPRKGPSLAFRQQGAERGPAEVSPLDPKRRAEHHT
jgi:hypothetical protein